MIDFEIPADVAARRDQIRAFVTEKIVPFERDPRLTRHGPNEDLRNEMVGMA
ncbi:MAG: acyl-CoA dehydrogenase, partial [Mycobacteriaceae bacterium]